MNHAGRQPCFSARAVALCMCTQTCSHILVLHVRVRVSDRWTNGWMDGRTDLDHPHDCKTHHPWLELVDSTNTYSRRSIIRTFDYPNLSIKQTKGCKPMLLMSTNLQFDNPNYSIIRTQVWQSKCSDYLASTVLCNTYTVHDCRLPCLLCLLL